MDLHDAQYQGFFDIPVDNLKAYPIFTNYIRDHVRDIDNAVIVSPDAGGAKRAIQMAQIMGAGFALIHKERRKKRGSYDAMDLSMVSTQGGFSNSSGAMTPLVHGRTIVGDVKEKTVIIVDDIADTCNTLIKAAQVAVAYGAKRVLAFVSHGIFSGNALDRLMSLLSCQRSTRKRSKRLILDIYSQRRSAGFTTENL
jgi:ribose-phosphate pyrophosphokinase